MSNSQPSPIFKFNINFLSYNFSFKKMKSYELEYHFNCLKYIKKANATYEIQDYARKKLRNKQTKS